MPIDEGCPMDFFLSENVSTWAGYLGKSILSESSSYLGTKD
jgi:hypothetical protein